MFIEKTLGQLCELGKGKIQTGPFGSQLHQADYSEEGTPVVMPADIIDGKISEAKIARVSEDHVMRLERHQLAIGDIVYGRRGDIGRQALITSKEEGWLCGTGCLRITVGKKSPIDPEYLHLYLKMSDVISYIQNQAIGATMPNLNTEILKRIPIRYPEKIADQKKVIAVLKAYFDLIENNKNRIQILENMAEELYKEWFVRFRFPNWENTEFEKGVPKDWRTINSGEFIDVVKGKSYTSPEIHDGFVDESLPFINLKNFNRGGGYRRNGLKFYTGKYANNQKTYQDDIVMAVTDMTQDRAVVGRVARVPKLNFEFAIISLDCVKLVPKIYSSTFTYCYFKYSGFSEYIKEFANGANVLHLSPNQIGKQKILIPPKQLVNSFEAIVVPIYSELNILEESNEKLETMRNNLLPRLISGKLSVENLDIQFPPSMQEQ